MLAIALISVITGLILVIIAIFYKQKSNIFIGLGIIGIFLIFYSGFTYGTLFPINQNEIIISGNRLEVEYPINEVQLISPVNGDTVGCRILTMGVYPRNHLKDIWVLLKPSDGKYYPQSDFTEISYKENGNWQVVTRFGGDEGEVFDVVVFETDKRTTTFFSNTIIDWKLNEDYIGLELDEIPSGATEVQRIQVSLAKNCRGIH